MTTPPSDTVKFGPVKGRGAIGNPDGRFERYRREALDDGWPELSDSEVGAPRTELTAEATRTILATNESPDVPFDRSVNPYKGCEHGCIYCFARPTHAYLGLSPGRDFETRLRYKPDAAAKLAALFAARTYRPRLIALGANTDPYQPAERRLGITREILEVCRRYNHPVSIVTKSALVLRDADILADMAGDNLVEVCISLTTLDTGLARIMEPRATAPAAGDHRGVVCGHCTGDGSRLADDTGYQRP